ncbi:hypothetical protein BVRB_7g158140 [Beta vulgaris subsp. vulgaris]|nr:hypothetical protein BVRB_7g158140 [Beta vulgaris subsp. vulgaris]
MLNGLLQITTIKDWPICEESVLLSDIITKRKVYQIAR